MIMKLVTKIYDETLGSNENQFWSDLEWVLDEKLEYNLTLSNNSISIPVSSIDNIQLIVLETDSEIDLTLYRDSTNELLTISSLFVFTPSENEDFISLELSEDTGLVEANVRLRVYGEQRES